MSKQYILRERDNNEISRLQFQHQVWKEETDLAIHMVGIQSGDRIVDLGAGPGYLSIDLAEKTGMDGQVIAVDNSPLFIGHINSLQVPNITGIEANICSDLPKVLTNGTMADHIFCRWVLMFIDQCEKVIKDSYDLLAPGGQFVSLEYFNFRHISMFPEMASFDLVFDKVWDLIRSNGGDPDVGSAAFQHMLNAGYRNVKVHPVYKTGKSGSLTWQWLEQTNQNHTNLVKAGLLTQEQLDQFYQDWEQYSKLEQAFITAPPLVITMGTK